MSRGDSSVSRSLDRSSAPQETDDHLLEVSVSREQLNHYRNLAENVRSELAASLVKLDCAQSELQDLRTKMLSKEVYCQELKVEMESYKENDARRSSLIASMRRRIQELEEDSTALSASKNRTAVTAHTAMRENQELMKRITELDEKLTNCSKENEETMKQASENLRRHEEFRIQLCDALGLDKKRADSPDEDLILKLRELCKENTLMKGQIVTLEETINVHEMEAKANRETIMRLASEVKIEQTRAASCTAEKDKLKQDLLGAEEAKGALEREVKLLRERLLAGQRASDASKQELSFLKKSSRELEMTLKTSRDAAATLQTQNSSFREKIAALLWGRLGTAGSTEDAILQRIEELSSQEKCRKRMASQLEAQISELVEQLGNESEFHQKALQRAHEAENKLETLQGQLNRLEEELVSGDVLRDNLNSEKQKYLKFLDQLSEKMKLSQMAAELGFDMRLDVVLARTEQLVRLESNAVLENKTIAHNLQRKVPRLSQLQKVTQARNAALAHKGADASGVRSQGLKWPWCAHSLSVSVSNKKNHLKTQKERLENKELHMNLLRQKIAQLQEEKQVRTALAVERDEAHVTIRKLEKKVERLQKELSAYRESNTELKAKLADTNELKIKTLEQTKAIEDLNESLDKLEKLKTKAERKLVSVRSELGTTELEAKEDKERARNMMEAVTSEMKTLKKSLEEAEKREKQLVDFREVVSQMLGLNMTMLALPDYEIIKCLERLIHSHHHHHVACACLKDMTTGQEGCPQGYLKLLH